MAKEDATATVKRMATELEADRAASGELGDEPTTAQRRREPAPAAAHLTLE